MYLVNEHDSKKLIGELEYRGFHKNEIIAVFQKGSSLFLDDPTDIDFLIVTEERPRRRFPFAEPFFLNGFQVDGMAVSLEEWKDPETYMPDSLVFESVFYRCIYGDASKVPTHSPKQASVLKRTLNLFRDNLFFPSDESRKWPLKRMFAFLTLANYMGVSVDDSLMDMAHRGELDPKDYVHILNELDRLGVNVGCQME